ncbi:MAG TPA: chromate efflux transporter [Puia sp.]|jgi:chromate transporter|nr:chromate efflux transporter [Puia sp.]
MAENTRLRELAKLFGRLGMTAFGGPAAHIAMMQKEVVDRRHWMDHQHFLDLIGATNLIPGPNSTEMAIHIGQERGGWKGLLIAGACFILPAVFITGVIAWAYRQYGQLPQVTAFIYGIKPAVIAVIAGAVYPLAKKAFKTRALWVIGGLALVAGLLGLNEIAVLFGGGAIAMAWYALRRPGATAAGFLPWALLQVQSMNAYNLRIFFTFLKIGAILYGSGYVLFAFLDSELVAKGLLSRQQLMDAIAVGQFTPGPVFSSVTFIGWQLNGLTGAVLATVAVFLPSFVFVAALNPLVPLMRRSRLFSAFLDGVNVASVAIIITVCVEFGRDTVTGWRTIVIAILGCIATFGFRSVNSAWVILGGGVLGYLLTLVR